MKRPFATHYYDAAGNLIRKGATSNEENAVRAMAGRTFTGQYRRAVVVERSTGVAVLNIKRSGAGFRIGFGSGVAFREWQA